MNFEGIIIAVICFACIGLFHPIVIKCEYYLSAKCWPAFMVIGIVLIIVSLLVKHTIGCVTLGVLGCSCLWSIIELKEQEERVKKGWFPKNEKKL